MGKLSCCSFLCYKFHGRMLFVQSNFQQNCMLLRIHNKNILGGQFSYFYTSTKIFQQQNLSNSQQLTPKVFHQPANHDSFTVSFIYSMTTKETEKVGHRTKVWSFLRVVHSCVVINKQNGRSKAYR